jgi:hypothetical protein
MDGMGCVSLGEKAAGGGRQPRSDAVMPDRKAGAEVQSANYLFFPKASGGDLDDLQSM